MTTALNCCYPVRQAHAERLVRQAVYFVGKTSHAEVYAPPVLSSDAGRQFTNANSNW